MADTVVIPDFVRDVDKLRRGGRLDDAELVAIAGLTEHPYVAAGHHALARVVYARGDLQRARDEWEMALALAPDHLGALKGLGSLALTHKDYASAERYLEAAESIAPTDVDVRAALKLARDHVHDDSPRHTTLPLGVALIDRSTQPFQRSVDGGFDRDRPLRAPYLPAFEDPRLIAAVVADGDGLVVDAYSRHDAPPDVSATLAGLTKDLGVEAAMTSESLGLGAWDSLTVECTDGSIVVTTDRSRRHAVAISSSAQMPLGLVRRYVTQLRTHVEGWSL